MHGDLPELYGREGIRYLMKLSVIRTNTRYSSTGWPQNLLPPQNHPPCLRLMNLDLSWTFRMPSVMGVRRLPSERADLAMCNSSSWLQQPAK